LVDKHISVSAGAQRTLSIFKQFPNFEFDLMVGIVGIVVLSMNIRDGTAFATLVIYRREPFLAKLRSPSILQLRRLVHYSPLEVVIQGRIVFDIHHTRRRRKSNILISGGIFAIKLLDVFAAVDAILFPRIKRAIHGGLVRLDVESPVFKLIMIHILAILIV
jgi:hypothetical protein